MRFVCKLLLGLAFLQFPAYAADEPKIEVVDGRISISAQAVPLGRFLMLLDKAMGLKSEVKAGLENRNISVQFTDLDFHDAVRKIFQGQPLNYLVVEGKGIRVTDLAQQGATGSSGVADTQSFINSPQPINSPFQVVQPAQQAQPIQINPNIQPAGANIFGSPPPPAANGNPQAPVTPPSGPGVIPPPIGGNNPLIAPVGGAAAGGNVLPGNGVPAPVLPPAPGTLPGAAPGAVK